jgi:hypothetical protein
MATLEGRTTNQPRDPDQTVVAVVDAAELEAAKREPGVRALLREAATGAWGVRVHRPMAATSGRTLSYSSPPDKPQPNYRTDDRG